MEKSRRYEYTKFSPEVILEAKGVLESRVLVEENKPVTFTLSLDVDEDHWRHDSEAEFFSDYRRSDGSFRYGINIHYGKYSLFVSSYSYSNTTVEVCHPNRAAIEEIFEVFERNENFSKIPVPETPKEEVVIFIGHGRNDQWRELKNHLQEKHHYQIEAYEIGERAGHTIRDVLETMLTKSSIALLVMTGEDETTDGEVHARDNVIHELGLFQGKLGFHRAIVLLEHGTTEFSNIHGIQQIRFEKDRIAGTYGDILALLKREFGTI